MSPVKDSEIQIKSYDFSPVWLQLLKSENKWINWPVVYLLHNDKGLYVWETSSAISRMNEHGKTDKKKLTNIEIIFDDTFNKSAILDIEQNLIKLFNADWKYKLWNQNWWQSTMHDYYQREFYVSKVDKIWESLMKMKLSINPIEVLRNSDLFKFSPYNSLTEEQNNVSKSIIYDMINTLSKWKEWISIIEWWAWTWKTIVLINMMYKLINAMNTNFDKAVDEDSDLSDYVQLIRDIQNYINEYNNWKPLKMAYISQMEWLRKTLKFVFSKTKWLSSKMVVWPLDIVNDVYKTREKYDIVFVDESHRLAQRKNIWWMWTFDAAARKCWMDPKESNVFDFIMHCSKYKVLVYDKNQTVKWSDITPEQFRKSLWSLEPKLYKLSSQMRCNWWESYINYVSDLLNCRKGLIKQNMDNDFELKMYYDADKMVNKIKELDKKFDLCRNVSWYSRDWISKWMKYDDIIKNGKEDIEINWKKYIWNTCLGWWITSKNAINEIWCIHTVQGYDLNYVWVIFWKEIDYDEVTNKIIINKNEVFDKYVKQWASDLKLEEYVLNSYKVLMTRWIKWCYVYAYNEWLRKYLSRFIDKVE